MSLFSHEIPNASCPHCGKAVDAATPAGPNLKPPADGDLAICFYCCKPAIYCLGGTSMRLPNEQEEQNIAADPTVARMRSAWVQLQLSRLKR